MQKKKGRQSETVSETKAELRKRAEREFASRNPFSRNLTSSEKDSLLHELEVHQIELEIQNEELRRAQQELQESRNLYTDLFDFAPVGYFVLDRHFLILEVNLTGSQMLGLERGKLLGRRFTHYIASASQDVFHHCLEKKTRETETACELVMEREDSHSNSFDAELRVVAITSVNSDSHFRIAVIDVTQRKQTELKEKKRTDELMALSRATSALVEPPPEQDLYQLIAEQVQRLARGVYLVIVSSFDESTNLFQVKALSGHQSDIAAFSEVIRQDLMGLAVPISSEARTGLTAGTLQRVPRGLFDLTSGLIPEAAARKIEEQLNIGNIYSMGFYWREKLYGSVSFLSAQGQEIGSPDILETFIHESAIALQRKEAMEAVTKAKDELEIKVKQRTEQLQEAYDEIIESQKALIEANKQLKQYANRITQVQEEERRRIAYELHDDTAQYLSILKMQLGALADSGKIRSQEIKEKLQFLERDADRAFNDVRRYSHELRPVVLEHAGLVPALEQIADDYNKLGQLAVEVNVEGIEPDLTEEVKLGLFRIAQEALNNSRKHAKASQANIDIRFNHKQVRMAVSDNGEGFNMEEALKNSGDKGSLGLLSMHERADLINADLKIESTPGKGTKVIARAELAENP